MGLVGTRWVRADGTVIEITGDSESGSGRSNRSLQARNMSNGRSFWVTPEGLHRKYRSASTAE